MINAIEKIMIDTFIALLCKQQAKQKKITLQNMFTRTMFTAFSPEAGDYFVWQLCLQGGKLGIVGCGATEFSWLVEQWKQTNSAIAAFEALLHEKEKMLKQQKEAFFEAFLAWFDHPIAPSLINNVQTALLAIIPSTIVQTGSNASEADRFLSLRLKPWVNRLFLMLEEKDPEHHRFHLVSLLDNKLFTLLNEQIIAMTNARKETQQAFVFWLHDKSTDKALQTALSKLRESIVMEGNEGLDDISGFLSILLEPVATNIINTLSVDDANNAILACERLAEQWFDRMNVINTGEQDNIVIALQCSLVSLRMLHALLEQKRPLDITADDRCNPLEKKIEYAKERGEFSDSDRMIHNEDIIDNESRSVFPSSSTYSIKVLVNLMWYNKHLTITQENIDRNRTGIELGPIR